ncbi:MAG: 4-hydroxythreonine-4-phosphate dehydrogenase PdxA [Bacteroidia bacterium]|nr:4-hydroxythreonine-4-phosphate dehydrogenase PdxA [Bacteroidia bacterium]
MEKKASDKIKIGITQGDINGIGYEVIIKTLLDARIVELCTPVVYGSPKVVAYHRKALNITNFSLNNIKKADDANPKRANVINCLDDNIRVEFGKSTDIAGDAALKSLELAVADLKGGKIDALVTAPINKNNMPHSKFPYPGHTEYLEKIFNFQNTLMLMVSPVLRVGIVSGHIPFSRVTTEITHEKILQKLRILNQSLINDFTVRKPRIAILGLNPHAGDNGFLGSEENNVIVPAIQQARNENIIAIGPIAADGFFGSSSYKKYDAVLAMYHDQGLAPFKAICFNEGVNYTAGLPVIRTSPAHGTAYELVGKNEASEESFRQAIYLACDIYKNRILNKELSKNPLKHFDKENL